MDEAIGTLGLSPDVFWSLTWADFVRLLEAWVHNQNQDWDRTRYASTVQLNTAIGRKRSIQPKDLFPLPHDKVGKSKVELPTEEEMKAVAERKLSLPSK